MNMYMVIDMDMDDNGSANWDAITRKIVITVRVQYIYQYQKW